MKALLHAEGIFSIRFKIKASCKEQEEYTTGPLAGLFPLLIVKSVHSLLQTAGHRSAIARLFYVRGATKTI